MKDYELEILDQYEIEIRSTRKVRGAFFCDTNEGTMLLKEATISDRRALFLYKMLCRLSGDGFPNVDIPVVSKEGNLVSTSRDGSRYMLKRWFNGRECDVHREAEVLESVRNLAFLHQKMHWKKESEEESPSVGRHLKEEFLCHNRELKKVRSFIRNKVNKGDFEYLFLQCFEKMYQTAARITKRLENSGYEDLYKKSIESGCLVHGDYNYHNILFSNVPFAGTGTGTVFRGADRMAATNFEHFRLDVQIQDLYYFLRKVMEKHKWNERLGLQMLETYSAVRPLETAEWEYIAMKLAYPEKFWKIANTYYHSNKAWIPEKNVEKLKTTVIQSEEKQRFLRNVLSFSVE